jgi:hypothetical protein
MTINNRLIINFIAIAAPFLLWLGYQFFVLGVTYWDGTTNYEFEGWLYSSMGWSLSKWPFFLHDAAFGFRTHYPAILQSQLVALYGTVFGWPGDNLTDFSRFGIWLNVIAIFIASAWGAVLAKSLKISVLPLFASAALVVSNPAYSFTWLVYPHFLPMLIPVGLAIFSMSQKPGSSVNPSRVIFLVLGYLLSMHYVVAQTIVALGAAILVSLWAVDGGPVYQAYSAKPTNLIKRIIIIGILAVIVFGFAAIMILFSDRVASFIGAAELPVAVLMVMAFAGLAILSGATYLAVKRLSVSKMFSFLFATVGDGAIGLALGANLLLFMSWQRGFLGGFAQSKSNEFSFNFDELFNFMFLSRPWNWFIPMLVLGALYIGAVALFGKSNKTGQSKFIGTFSIVLMGLVLLQAMPELADAAEAPKGSILDFYSSRLVVGGLVAAPVILVWYWQYNHRIGNFIGIAALVIALLAARDYYQFAIKIIDREGLVAVYVKDTVGSYLNANPNAQIICVNDRMAGLCTTGFVWAHYQTVHKSYPDNGPLPVSIDESGPRFIFSKKRNCEKLESCLDIPSVRDYRILVAGRTGQIPKVIISNGNLILGKDQAPAGVLLMEIAKKR